MDTGGVPNFPVFQLKGQVGRSSAGKGFGTIVDGGLENVLPRGFGQRKTLSCDRARGYMSVYFRNTHSFQPQLIGFSRYLPCVADSHVSGTSDRIVCGT